MKILLYLLCAIPVVGWSQKPPPEPPVPISWDWPTKRITLINDTVILDGPGIRFLRIGSHTYRIVWSVYRLEGYIKEIVPDSTEFLPDIIINTPLNVSNGGRNDWEGTDTAKIAAHLNTIRLPYSMDSPNTPFTGTCDSSGMWIWGRNKGIDYLDWPNRYPPMREAPITGYILPDSFRIFSANLALAGDTTFLAAPSKKHTKKKP